MVKKPDRRPLADQNLEGVWGSIARRFPERGKLARALVDELDEGLALLEELQPALTFFGGARIDRTDPFFEAAERMGEFLADRAIPPRTGAGPGIMTAVPEGFRRRLLELGEVSRGEAVEAEAEAALVAKKDGSEPVTGRARMLTQGFNIHLPFEQSINPAIDVALELTHFPTRKLLLWKKALGLVVFPGGFGTLDELLEVWRHKQRKRLDLPIILFGRNFWTGLWEGIRRGGEEHSHVTISLQDLDFIDRVTDDPEEVVNLIDGFRANRVLPEPPSAMGRRIASDLFEALDYLDGLKPAVTFLGGSLHEETDRTIRTAEAVAEILAREGEMPTRAGAPAALSMALYRGGHNGRKHLPQQAFGLRREGLPTIFTADRVHIVEDRLTHKVLLTENTSAFVALPGGLGTLDELFSILCQLQTGKIPPRRVVLIGSTFWRPIFDAIAEQMLEGSRKTISPGDLDLVTITDDADEAAALCLEPPEDLPLIAQA